MKRFSFNSRFVFIFETHTCSCPSIDDIDVGERDLHLIVILSQLRPFIKIQQRLKYQTIEIILNSVDEANNESFTPGEGDQPPPRPYLAVLCEIEGEGSVKQFLEYKRKIKK